MAVVCVSGCGAAPSDRTLLARFREHQQEFETLRQMSDADRISGGVDPTTGSWSRVPEPRREQYRRLLDQLGFEHGLQRNDESGEVRFEVSCVGLVTSGYCKGIAYSAEPLTPMFDDLDESRADAKLLDAHVGYRSIEKHWYLYLQR